MTSNASIAIVNQAVITFTLSRIYILSHILLFAITYNIRKLRITWMNSILPGRDDTRISLNWIEYVIYTFWLNNVF